MSIIDRPYIYVIERKGGGKLITLGGFMVGCSWAELPSWSWRLWVLFGLCIIAFGTACERYQTMIETADTMEKLYKEYR